MIGVLVLWVLALICGLSAPSYNGLWFAAALLWVAGMLLLLKKIW